MTEKGTTKNFGVVFLHVILPTTFSSLADEQKARVAYGQHVFIKPLHVYQYYTRMLKRLTNILHLFSYYVPKEYYNNKIIFTHILLILLPKC